MHHLFLLLLLVLQWEEVRGLTPHVESVMKEMMPMRDCLPPNIVYAMSLWLAEVREHSHHRYLETVGLRELALQLDSRSPLCHALEMTLRRISSAHRYALAQRESASTPILKNDGWKETSVRLKNALQPLKNQCALEFSLKSKGGEKAVSRCMRAIEKKSVTKLMVHYMDQ